MKITIFSLEDLREMSRFYEIAGDLQKIKARTQLLL